MLGSRGPVGKRRDQVHGHRSQDELAVDKAPAGDELVWYDVDPAWCDDAKRTYESFRASGVIVFWEQSDVAQLHFLCTEITRYRQLGKFSGQGLQAILSGLTELGATEGARRRMKIELQRDTGPQGESETDVAIAELLGQF